MSIKDTIKAAKTQKEKQGILFEAMKSAKFASPKTIRKWERAAA